MSSNIEGKVVVITGASSGLGEAAARLLSSEGASVVLGARRVERPIPRRSPSRSICAAARSPSISRSRERMARSSGGDSTVRRFRQFCQARQLAPGEVLELKDVWPQLTQLGKHASPGDYTVQGAVLTEINLSRYALPL